jgi:hypothetical protein
MLKAAVPDGLNQPGLPQRVKNGPMTELTVNSAASEGSSDVAPPIHSVWSFDQSAAYNTVELGRNEIRNIG